MALEASNYKKAQVANAEFGGVAYTPTATFLIKLFTDTVDLDGDGTELTSDGYAAKTVTNNLTNFPSTTTGQKLNAVEITFDELEENSDEIVSAGIFDNATGEMLYRKVYDTPFSIGEGFAYKLRVNDLIFTVS